MINSSEQLSGLSPAERRALLAELLRAKGSGPRAFPLSFAQQRMWFLDQLAPGSPAYIISTAVRLTGGLDVGLLKCSLDAIMRRHETLRTTFTLAQGRPVQVVALSGTFPLALLDLQAVPAPNREAAARQLATAEAQRPFDLARGPLTRATLLRLGPREHVALIMTHHIISDGWSAGVLVQELVTFYKAFAAGTPAALPPLPTQYAAFAVWQRQWLQGSGVWGLGSGVWGQEATAPLPPPAGGGTEGGRSQESEVDEGQTQNSKLKTPRWRSSWPTGNSNWLAYRRWSCRPTVRARRSRPRAAPSTPSRCPPGSPKRSPPWAATRARRCI